MSARLVVLWLLASVLVPSSAIAQEVPRMACGHGMMGMMGWPGAIMMFLGAALVLAAIGALVAAAVFLVRRSRPAHR